MKNANFLSKILTSDCRYFIVAKENYTNEYSRRVRKDDSILLVSIPFNFSVDSKLEDLKFVEIQKLNDSYAETNIILNAGYFPFQIGIRFSDFYTGFPLSAIEGNGWCFDFKPFLIEALSLESNSIYDYEKLAIEHKLLKK